MTSTVYVEVAYPLHARWEFVRYSPAGDGWMFARETTTGAVQSFPPGALRPLEGHAPMAATCTSCGQTATTRDRSQPAICGRCRDELRAPQGEAVRLFQPAPAQIPGQLNFIVRSNALHRRVPR